ncbi:metallophosphoesterase family protein [Gordonia aichiensis]|uniref:metallophosphoesterase family protein n=1 Tax=Gordonia aichiensis TaxID=36820 RepID=UPI003263178E
MTTNTVFSLGFYGCAHLGYRMSGMARQHPSGLNIREVDGYAAYEQVMAGMIAAGVDVIVDGGDTFHTHTPTPRSIDEALRIDDLRVAAEIERITNSGNHDAASSTQVSAVASVHRPTLGSRAVFPRQERNGDDAVGPWPGLYEVHQPNPDLPLYLHVVSHYGLNPRLADRGIDIDPQPVPDAVNILVAHGIFSADDRLFGADDRHGATRIIPSEWVDRGFSASILSDYHTPGPIPGFGPDDRKAGQVWMTGSVIGRGFSDDICTRGWLLVELGEDGYVTVTLKPVWMRPQRDFEPIDCTGSSVADINELVHRRLAEQDWWDDQSAEITGDGGWILRQQLIGATPTQRHGVRALAGEWSAAAGQAAYWGVSFAGNALRDAVDGGEHPDRKIGRNSGGRAFSYIDDFTSRRDHGRVAAVIAGASNEVREAALSKVTATLTDLQTTTGS